MRRYWNSPQKVETSKKLLIFTVAMVIIITIVTVIAVFVIQDVTPLEFLIGGIFGLATTAFGFYYWKAKAENLAKFGRQDEITDEEE